MSRFGNEGRFGYRYELANVFEGMREDLQEFAGQFIPWYTFDAQGSESDPIYDVGADDDSGRDFNEPFLLPVLGVDLEEGVEVNTGQGSYTTDICHLVVSYDQAERAGLRHMSHNWRLHLNDRFVYNDTVFQVRNIQIRGPVRERYTVIGIDGWQVNREELINDEDFHKYAGPGSVPHFLAHEKEIQMALENPPQPEDDSAERVLPPTEGPTPAPTVEDTEVAAAPTQEVVDDPAPEDDDLYGVPRGY